MRTPALIVLVAALLAGSGAAAAAHDIGDDVADLVGRLMPSVVNISSVRDEPSKSPASASGAETGHRLKTLGSGFIIDASGIIVTNKHVIDGAREVSVTLDDDESYPAKVIAEGAQVDIALLKIDTGAPLPALHFGDSDKVRVGEGVLAIGNPLGIGESVSAGIVSALNRDIRDSPFDDYIQTDAAINHGNSGGPLFNLSGEVIGINTALYSNVPEGGSIGLGFSIPSNDSKFVIDELMRYGRVKPGWLGLHTQQVTPEIAEAIGLRRPEGALVSGVEPGGEADRAGIEPGDAIIQFNGIRIRDIRQLAREAGRATLDANAKVGVWRDGMLQTLSVKVTEMPGFEPQLPKGGIAAAVTEAPAFHLGLRLSPATPEARKLYDLKDDQAGCVVLDVSPAGAAADTGLAEGDVITQVLQHPVRTPNELMENVDKLRTDGRRFTLLLVVAKDGVKWVPLPLQ